MPGVAASEGPHISSASPTARPHRYRRRRAHVGIANGTYRACVETWCWLVVTGWVARRAVPNECLPCSYGHNYRGHNYMAVPQRMPAM